MQSIYHLLTEPGGSADRRTRGVYQRSADPTTRILSLNRRSQTFPRPSTGLRCSLIYDKRAAMRLVCISERWSLCETQHCLGWAPASGFNCSFSKPKLCTINGSAALWSRSDNAQMKHYPQCNTSQREETVVGADWLIEIYVVLLCSLSCCLSCSSDNEMKRCSAAGKVSLKNSRRNGIKK